MYRTFVFVICDNSLANRRRVLMKLWRNLCECLAILATKNFYERKL